MKLPYIAAVAAVCFGLLLCPTGARAESPLNHLFPWLFGPPDEGPKPEETLQAPFGNDRPKDVKDMSKDQAKIMDMYANDKSVNSNDDLTQPHRSPEQIGEWISGIVTLALSIDPKTHAVNAGKFKPLFSPYAWNEYLTFVSSSQLIETLQKNDMTLTAFSEKKPSMLQEGSLDGAYRWLYQVPVMLTYYKRDTKSLKGGAKAADQTQRITINIQLGRVSLKTLSEGMIIERWTVSKGQ